jgi:D-alanine--D-alanine ligase
MNAGSPSRLVVLFGGMSSEHEISLRSARSVLAAVDPSRFTAIPVGIRRDGRWFTGHADDGLETILESGHPVTDLRALQPDLVFPVLHGPYGEDGTVQGMLETWRIAYVGSGVLASAVCMDKAMQKHVIASAAPTIPLVPWIELDTRLEGAIATAVATVEKDLGFPCFTKPANLGSSVGVARCTDSAELAAALEDAARFDHKVVVEAGIDAREIEVAVLGNGGPETRVSSPGEIGLPPGVWYDYETKYEKDVATYHIPADLPRDTTERIADLALRAFRVCGCRGLARIDFLLDRNDGVPYLNELNTMPGFTSISMYPKLMAHAGVSYGDLVGQLCDLGIAHHAERSRLTQSRT